MEHYAGPDEPILPEALEVGARVLVRRFFVTEDGMGLGEQEPLHGTVVRIPDWEAITAGQVALSGAQTYFNIDPDGGASTQNAFKVVHYTDWPAIYSGRRCRLRTQFYLLPDSDRTE